MVFYVMRLIFREFWTFLLWLGGNVIGLALITGVHYGTREAALGGAIVGVVTGLICYGVSLRAKRYTDCPKCGGGVRERGEPTSKHHYGICNFCGGAKILRPNATEGE